MPDTWDCLCKYSKGEAHCQTQNNGSTLLVELLICIYIHLNVSILVHISEQGDIKCSVVPPGVSQC